MPSEWPFTVTTSEPLEFPPDPRDATIAKLRSLLREAAQVIDDVAAMQDDRLDAFVARLREEAREQ